MFIVTGENPLPPPLNDSPAGGGGGALLNKVLDGEALS